MSWNSGSDFLAMGGYGLYVWGSLSMCAAVLIAEVILLKSRRLSLVRDMNAAISADTEEVNT